MADRHIPLRILAKPVLQPHVALFVGYPHHALTMLCQMPVMAMAPLAMH